MADQPDATLVASRRFGDATVTLISEGTFPWRLKLQAPEAAWRRAMPEADAGGAIRLGTDRAGWDGLPLGTRVGGAGCAHGVCPLTRGG